MAYIKTSPERIKLMPTDTLISMITLSTSLHTLYGRGGLFDDMRAIGEDLVELYKERWRRMHGGIIIAQDGDILGLT